MPETPGGNGMSDRGNRPLDVLEASVGDDVTVHLKGGETYEGLLAGYDQHMNLVVKEGEDTTIIRGDNVVSIRP
jgi:small nuclear ribonucleoprotein